MVLAKGSKGHFLNDLLVDGSWHFDFLNDGLGIGNLQMKITIPFTPPIAEILCVINPRAIVVCGFLMKSL